MEYLSEWAGKEDQKTLALMSRVVDMGLETVDIAMERKKMKAAAVKLDTAKPLSGDGLQRCPVTFDQDGLPCKFHGNV